MFSEHMVLESVSMGHGNMVAGVCLFALFLLWLEVKVNNQLCFVEETRKEAPFISCGSRQSSLELEKKLVGAILPCPTIRFYRRGSALVCLDTVWVGVVVAVG